MAQKQNNVEEKRYYSNHGTHYKQDIKYKFSEADGCMIPYFDEKYNMYEQIQLAKSSVDLDMIIKRAKAGDLTVLNVRQANYGDISDMPDNLNDFHQLQETIKDNFNSLKPEIRALFGNNIDSFSQAVTDGTYVSILNNYAEALNNSKSQDKEGD